MPLEGRPLGGGRYLQGDVFAGMALWRRTNACADPRPDGFARIGSFQTRSWLDCTPGSALELALTPDGHLIPPDWAGMVLDWAETGWSVSGSAAPSGNENGAPEGTPSQGG